jgi:hypothetical protein
MRQREPRGFAYALAPLQGKCDWELQELLFEMSRLHGDIACQQARVDAVENRFRDAQAALAGQQTYPSVIHIDRQILARAYIMTLGEQVAHARQALVQLVQELDQMSSNFHRLQQFSDGLVEHRDQNAKHFGQALQKAEIVVADDDWLRAIHWRNGT